MFGETWERNTELSLEKSEVAKMSVELNWQRIKSTVIYSFC